MSETKTPTLAQPLGELVLANPAQQAQRWRAHHQAWGSGMDLALYLRREEALAEADFCRTSLRLWLLLGDGGQVLASCETYAGQMWVVDAAGRMSKERLETVASVLVEPELRNQGHAARLLRLLKDKLVFERTPLTSLYSDVGPQLYRRTGYLLHAARQSVRRVEAGTAWPEGVRELGLGDVADLLKEDGERQGLWLSQSSAPGVAEVARAGKIAWFQMRSQYRAWARGQEPHPVIGARTAEGGYMLWTADAPEPVLHSLVWRPRSREDAGVLAQAACAFALERGLQQVIWWDADRDTGLDPFRGPELRPPGAVASGRERALPMLGWLDGSRPFPLVWMNIERFGWA